jgi:hypothetical protein
MGKILGLGYLISHTDTLILNTTSRKRYTQKLLGLMVKKLMMYALMLLNCYI